MKIFFLIRTFLQIRWPINWWPNTFSIYFILYALFTIFFTIKCIFVFAIKDYCYRSNISMLYKIISTRPKTFLGSIYTVSIFIHLCDDLEIIFGYE